MKFGKVEVSKKELIDGFVKTITEGAKKADTNKDGCLTLSDGKKLPEQVRDNFKNYVAATRDVFGQGSGVQVKDTTSPATLLAHSAAYGDARVSHKDAFKKAIDAVMKSEDGETPASRPANGRGRCSSRSSATPSACLRTSWSRWPSRQS